MNNTVKRGVSLYSYQQEYYLGRMNLEDCVKAVADLGADGVELITEAMVPGFPNPSDEFVDNWKALMAKYGTKPTCYDAFLDFKMYKHRPLTRQEQVEQFVRDIKLAARMGFQNIRVLAAVPNDLIVEVLPVAEEYGIRLGKEIHSPYTFSTPWVQELCEAAAKKNTKFMGITPDLGIFVRRLPRILLQNFLRQGATPAIVERIDECYQNRLRVENLMDEVLKMGGNQVDFACAQTSGHYVCTDTAFIKDYIPYMVHIHAKFYEMTDESREWSIPNEEIVLELVKFGYDGYLSSEYEGQRHWHDQEEVEADSVEQVRRQHAMFRRLLGE